MHSLFYWTGAIVWTLVALALGIVAVLFAWMITIALARTCSVLRFHRALRRKGQLPAEPSWWASALWLFKRVWESDSSLEFRGKDGSRWNGIGKWTINDSPWPTPEPPPKPRAHPVPIDLPEGFGRVLTNDEVRDLYPPSIPYTCPECEEGNLIENPEKPGFYECDNPECDHWENQPNG